MESFFGSIELSNNHLKDYNGACFKLKLPFLPHSKNPKEIAKIIDNFVESPQFRIESYNQQLEFVKKTSDPNKCAEWWDNLFENMIKRHKSIMKNSSRFSMKLRMLNFLIANRLYFYKLKKIFQTK